MRWITHFGFSSLLLGSEEPLWLPTCIFSRHRDPVWSGPILLTALLSFALLRPTHDGLARCLLSALDRAFAAVDFLFLLILYTHLFYDSWGVFVAFYFVIFLSFVWFLIRQLWVFTGFALLWFNLHAHHGQYTTVSFLLSSSFVSCYWGKSENICLQKRRLGGSLRVVALLLSFLLLLEGSSQKRLVATKCFSLGWIRYQTGLRLSLFFCWETVFSFFNYYLGGLGGFENSMALGDPLLGRFSHFPHSCSHSFFAWLLLLSVWWLIAYEPRQSQRDLPFRRLNRLVSSLHYHHHLACRNF